jgi:hypothetical protein
MASKAFVEYHDSIRNSESQFPTILDDYSIQDFLQTPEGKEAGDILRRFHRVWHVVKQSSWKYNARGSKRIDVILNRRIRKFVELYIRSHPLGFFFGSNATRSLSDQTILVELRTEMEKEHFLYSLDSTEETPYLPSLYAF